MSTLPYAGICVVERSGLLSARLIGLLLADQGAQVLVAQSDAAPQATKEPLDPSLHFEHLDPYLNRGKGLLQTSGDQESATADIIIVQGNAPWPCSPGRYWCACWRPCPVMRLMAICQRIAARIC